MAGKAKLSKTFEVGGIKVRLMKAATYKSHYEWLCPRCGNAREYMMRPTINMLVCNECKNKEWAEKECQAEQRWLEQNPKVKDATVVGVRLRIGDPHKLILKTKDGEYLKVEISSYSGEDKHLTFEIIPEMPL